MLRKSLWTFLLAILFTLILHLPLNVNALPQKHEQQISELNAVCIPSSWKYTTRIRCALTLSECKLERELGWKLIPHGNSHIFTIENTKQNRLCLSTASVALLSQQDTDSFVGVVETCHEHPSPEHLWYLVRLVISLVSFFLNYFETS